MKIPSGTPNSILPLSPRKLISFWDMNQIVAKEFLAAWKLLGEAFALAPKGRDQKATKDETELLTKALIEVHYQCGRLGMSQSVELCNRLLDQLMDPAAHRIWISAGLGRYTYTMPKEVPFPDFESVYWQMEGIEDRRGTECDGR